MDTINSRLSMEIGIEDNGDLAVADTSLYEQGIQNGELDIGHIVGERVIKYSEDDDKLIIIAENITEPTSAYDFRGDKTFTLLEDGLYHYQRLVIPSYEHRGNGEQSIYFIKDDTHLNNIEGHLFLEETGTNENLINEIDFTTAMDCIAGDNSKVSNVCWFDDYVFSIYNLIKCYVLTEKKRIANGLKNNCKADCNTINSINTNADILMAAVTVLTHLIQKRQFVEAYRLLNGLRTCDNLCQEFTEDIKGCGCGKSI